MNVLNTNVSAFILVRQLNKMDGYFKREQNYFVLSLLHIKKIHDANVSVFLESQRNQEANHGSQIHIKLNLLFVIESLLHFRAYTAIAEILSIKIM